ncbi:MAG TPA: hypothetical protein VEU62_22270 [Bryobacterales bacterium]|nr:hypothetical protein [Bryobacterales bacterium]
MILDRSHQNWALASAATGVAGAIAYIIYALRAPNGPTGSSTMGLFFGFAGTAVIVFECLLSLRKKYPASPLGRVQTWLKAHIWLGLLAFVLILFHAGFQWGRGLASLLMWMFVIITASGVYGLAVQAYIPRRMTELLTRETIYEQIPEVIRTLRLEADERVEFVTADLGITEEEDAEIFRAGGKKYYFDPAQRKSAGEKVEAERQRRKSAPQIAVEEQAASALRDHYLLEIRPFLFQKTAPFSQRLFQSAAAVGAYFQYLRTIMPVAAHEVLQDLESICEERRQFGVQQRLHRWLHGWLYVHVPLSMAFLVLTAVHAVISLRY